MIIVSDEGVSMKIISRVICGSDVESLFLMEVGDDFIFDERTWKLNFTSFLKNRVSFFEIVNYLLLIIRETLGSLLGLEFKLQS